MFFRSRAASTATALLACGLLQGCATHARLYPICNYSRPPDLATSQAQVETLRRAARASLLYGLDRDIIATTDGRWLIMTTSLGENSRLAKIWPRIGCIGDSSGSEDVRSEKACTGYISEFINSGNFLAYGSVTIGGQPQLNESPLPDGPVWCNSRR